MQAGAYQNATWVVGVAKAGPEEGVDQIGRSLHHRPDRRDRRAGRHRGDELVVARCDLDLAGYKEYHLQLRQAPRAAGLWPDRRAQGRGRAG